jgi:hypothetical protein
VATHRGFELLRDDESERTLLDAVVEFANLGSVASWEVITTWSEARENSPAAADERVISEERDALRRALAQVKSGPVPPDLIKMWTERASTISFSPTFSIEDRTLRVTISSIVRGRFDEPPSAPFAFALLLVVDELGPYVGSVCQCKLESCGKFFIAMRTGGMTRRLYCTREHMEQAHQATASTRVRNSREKRRRAKLKRRHK